MARKRLNKKIAIIGSGLLVVVLVLIIGVILYLSQDSEKFIRDGDLLLQQARGETDEDLKEEKYEKAAHNYHKARSLAKSDELRIEMLFKLADLYIETDEWTNTIGCWNNIISVEPKNIRARFNKLNYIYIMADSGLVQVWQDVASLVSDFLEVIDEDVYDEDIEQWKSFNITQASPIPSKLGSCLYFLGGRAAYEIAQRGALTDPNESLAKATNDLEKALQLRPDNISIYNYLAETMLERGKLLASTGNLEARDKAIVDAQELLEKAVEISDSPRAYINLLEMKFEVARHAGIEKIKALEPEYLELVQKFSSNPEVYYVLANHYVAHWPQEGYFEKARDTIQKAIELDKENVNYALFASNLYYRIYSVLGEKPSFEKAIRIAKNALSFPGAQEEPGPRRWVRKSSRTSLYLLIAKFDIEKIPEAEAGDIDENTKKQLVADAEQAVHQIEQLLGSGEDPRVIKWQGMLELAKGDRKNGIKKLYTTYEQYKASIKDPVQMDGHLAYTLGESFKDTQEIGASLEFYTAALNAYYFATKPKALLDYADILFRLKQYDAVLNMVKSYEDALGPENRSKTLRIKSYIYANQFDQAEQELEKTDLDSTSKTRLKFLLTKAKVKRTNTAIMRQKMRADEQEQDGEQMMASELKTHNEEYAQLLDKLIAIDPNAVGMDDIFYVCDNYVVEDNIGKARDVIEKFLEHFPGNIPVKVYARILNEPDPQNVLPQRRDEIELQVVEAISDPADKAFSLGQLYMRRNEYDKAMELFEEVVNLERISQQHDIELTDLQRIAIGNLFDTAIIKKDWNKAEQVVGIVRRLDIDGCEGNFFGGRLDMVRAEETDEQNVQTENLKKALMKFDICLQQKPVFSQCYLLRSRVNNILGNENAAIENAKKATNINPLDGNIARQLAFVLYQRNQRLGDTINTSQVIETKAALTRALRTNPNDVRLLGFYAEYISDENPEEALSIRQNLLKVAPDLQNAVFLGRLAMRIADKETEMDRKKALYDIAKSAFEQAKQIEPNSEIMLASYARYFEVIGQNEKATQLLSGQQNMQLLWQYYFQSGQIEEAKNVLEQLYQKDQKDSNVIRGLLRVALQNNDVESAKRYSEELVLLDGGLNNLIYQVQVYLNVGLIKETENKLQSLKEKYPDNLNVLLLESWLRMKQGRIDDSMVLINRTLEVNPENATAWRVRGELNRYKGDYAQAVVDLKKSKALEDNPVTSIALAKTYLKMDLAEDAVTELKNTVNDPKVPAATRLLLEQTYQHLRRTDDMVKFYKETLEKLPDSVVWNNKAAKFATSIRDLEWAEKLYKHALNNAAEKTQAKRTAFNGYLNVLLARGKMNLVFDEAAKHIDTDLAPIAFSVMAQAKLKLGDRETAVAYYRKAIDKAGTDDTLVAGVLKEMFRMLGSKEVLDYCNQKLQAAPDSLVANMTMFNLAKINGEFNKALDYVEKCIEIAKNDESLLLEYSMQKTMILQEAYMRTSDNDYLQRAIKQYESLLEKMPNNISVLNNLAYLLADNNEQLDKAIKYARRVYELTSSNPDFLDTYAYVLFKNKKYKEADEIINTAIQLIENKEMFASAEMYEHLGMIKSALGEKSQALEAYKQALKVGERRLSDKAKEKIEQAIEDIAY